MCLDNALFEHEKRRSGGLGNLLIAVRTLAASASKNSVVSIIPCWTAASNSNFREDAAMINITFTTTDDQDTIANGFQMGQFAFYGDLVGHTVPQTDQDLTSYLFSEIFDCLQPFYYNETVLPGSPTFALGYATGYLQAYLNEFHR
jgi:hypothetical protein